MNLPKVLLDSDILSEVLKGRDSNVRAQAAAYLSQHPVLTFTSATAFEILFGLERKAAHAQIQRVEAVFAINDEVVPEPQDYRLAAEISGALSRQGTPIGIIDPLNAACATRRGFHLATGNTAHYRFIQAAGYALNIVDWRNPVA